MKTNRVLAAALLMSAAVTLTASSPVSAEKKEGAFGSRTFFHGADISGKTPEEVAADLLLARGGIRIQIVEDGSVSTSGSPADFGYTLDEAELLEALRAAQAQKTGFLSSLPFLRKDREITEQEGWTYSESWSCDEEILYKKVDSRNLSVKRTPSRDAELAFNEETGRYEVKEEIYGNQFRREDMRQWAKNELDTFLEGSEDGRASCRVEVPETLYRQPAVTSDDPELAQLAEKLNAYADTSITYTFGEETRVLSFSTFRSWMSVQGGEIAWDEAAITDYVQQLAAETDTRDREKDFIDHFGQTVHFNAAQVEYGYRILQPDEVEQLKQDLMSGTSVVREPVYDMTDRWDDPCCYSRNGMDDLNGTYIEVSISDQYLWFYKDGEVIVETDCVTGNHERGWDTTHGVYGISGKASPAVLRGEGYETPVNYWMPFNGGQGLHDATWRGNFGGKIYRSNGSHGCVNLPLWAAEKIYENCKSGMAVVVY